MSGFQAEAFNDRSLKGDFAVPQDLRHVKKRRHPLIDMIVIAVAATLCGADGWVQIAQFGREADHRAGRRRDVFARWAGRLCFCRDSRA
jgi:hypothetical protein